MSEICHYGEDHPEGDHQYTVLYQHDPSNPGHLTLKKEKPSGAFIPQDVLRDQKAELQDENTNLFGWAADVWQFGSKNDPTNPLQKFYFKKNTNRLLRWMRYKDPEHAHCIDFILFTEEVPNDVFKLPAIPPAPKSTQKSAPDTIPLHGISVIQLASVAEGRVALMALDTFVKNQSPFDRQARTNISTDVTQDQYLSFVGNQVLAWTDAEKVTLTKMFTNIRERLEKLSNVFPDKILLVKTSGAEEGKAAYTRGENVVVLPQNYVSGPYDALEDVIIHELWHIYSKNNKVEREQAYALVHYHPTGNPVILPPKLAASIITNPDSPTHEYYITLNYNGNPTPMLPILRASRPYDGGIFFIYVDFKLVVLDGSVGHFTVRQDANKEAVLVDFKDVATEYFEKIGNNLGNSTEYFHPDEIIAINWVYTVDQPTIKLVADLHKLFFTK
eukprot:Phypoly_transcript_09560.p1 GENE.Phypoly_transcript_09560~~Phypoly_transcript_09560.p1  ORF type:complete len:444 (+),score=76.33 Phypoly_transcript_09560:54-1385(+)